MQCWHRRCVACRPFKLRLPQCYSMKLSSAWEQHLSIAEICAAIIKIDHAFSSNFLAKCVPPFYAEKMSIYFKMKRPAFTKRPLCFHFGAWFLLDGLCFQAVSYAKLTDFLLLLYIYSTGKIVPFVFLGMFFNSFIIYFGYIWLCIVSVLGIFSVCLLNWAQDRQHRFLLNWYLNWYLSDLLCTKIYCIENV